MSQIPKDPMILLSYINTQLRDFYPSLKAFCNDQELVEEEIRNQLKTINYQYDQKLNKFV